MDPSNPRNVVSVEPFTVFISVLMDPIWIPPREQTTSLRSTVCVLWIFEGLSKYVVFVTVKPNVPSVSYFVFSRQPRRCQRTVPRVTILMSRRSYPMKYTFHFRLVSRLDVRVSYLGTKDSRIGVRVPHLNSRCFLIGVRNYGLRQTCLPGILTNHTH